MGGFSAGKASITTIVKAIQYFASDDFRPFTRLINTMINGNRKDLSLSSALLGIKQYD